MNLGIALLFPLLAWIALYDIQYRQVHIIAPVLIICISFFVNDLQITTRLIGAAAGLPLLLYACKTRRLGGGDVKLVAAFGWCVGLVYALLVFSVAEFFFALTTRSHTKNPFAPYLCGAFLISVFLPQITIGGLFI